MAEIARRKSDRRPRAGKSRLTSRDVEVGRRVRVLRLQQRLSQTELANHLGVSFQQVQKYENGTNRISAGRLEQIAELFKVPVATLFTPSGAGSEGQKALLEYVDSAGALRLLQAYSKLSSTKAKQALVQIAVEMAGG